MLPGRFRGQHFGQVVPEEFVGGGSHRLLERRVCPPAVNGRPMYSRHAGRWANRQPLAVGVEEPSLTLGQILWPNIPQHFVASVAYRIDG